MSTVAVTSGDGQNGFETALDALLDRLADPDACADAAEALAMLMEERVRGRDVRGSYEPGQARAVSAASGAAFGLPAASRELRDIARRHLDTSGALVTDVPAHAKLVDGYIAVILAPPEL